MSQGVLSRNSIWERRKNLLTEAKTGRKGNLFDRDRQSFILIVGKDHKNTAPKIMVGLNDDLEKPVSSKTARRKLHKAGFHEGAAIRKPYQNEFEIS